MSEKNGMPLLVGTECAFDPRHFDAASPRFGRALFVTAEQQHLAEMPPAIDTSRIVGK